MGRDPELARRTWLTSPIKGSATGDIEFLAYVGERVSGQANPDKRCPSAITKEAANGNGVDAGSSRPQLVIERHWAAPAY